MKRIVLLLLVLVMMVVPFDVHASEVFDSVSIKTQITGDNLPASIKENLEDLNVSIKDSSLLEIVPLFKLKRKKVK